MPTESVYEIEEKANDVDDEVQTIKELRKLTLQKDEPHSLKIIITEYARSADGGRLGILHHTNILPYTPK